MAHHRLGQAEQASQALARARALGQRLPKVDGGELDLWAEWLHFHVVRREAEALVGEAGERGG